MILALVPERDLAMWRAAAARLTASWMVKVESHGYDGPALSECSVLLSHGPPSRSALSLAKELPAVRLTADLGVNTGKFSVQMAQDAAPGMKVAEFIFKAERFGGVSICHAPVLVALDRELDIQVEPPLPTTGPGAQGDYVLWPTDVYEGLGVRVSRDEPNVIQAAYEATQGNGPLWVKPGFPFLVPSTPSTFRSLDGVRVEGLLCTSVSRAGGWVVLTRSDVLTLLGHPGDVSWVQIKHLVGVQPAAALLGWLCSICTRLPSASASVGVDRSA
jgi:hypothetical protein